MRTMIVGLGSIGRRHLRNLVSLGEQDLLLVRTGKSTLPDAELVGYPSVKSLKEGLAWKPEAVIVANPTACHVEAALLAAQAGCHILLEKPVSNTMDRVPDLIRAAHASGSRILVGFQYRFHPCLLRLHQLLSARELGEPVHARAHYGEYLPGWHPWEDYRQSYSSRSDLGGGALLTLCHPFDYLAWLIGAPTDVTARTAALPHLELNGVEGIADVLLGLTGGAQATIHLDYAQRPPMQHLAVIGTEGSAECDLLSGELRWWTATEGEWHSFRVPEGFSRNDLFLAEMRHFVEVATRQATPICGLSDGVLSLKAALAALESSRSMGTVQLERSGS